MSCKKHMLMLAVSASISVFAQDGQRPTSSNYLQATAKADVVVPFSIEAQGKRFQPTWGLDLAWISEQNLRKGINHMGIDNVGIGRSAFRMTNALTNDSVLGSNQISVLRQRANLFNLVSSTLPIVLTADQEAGTDSYYFNANGQANVDRWAALVNSSVHWMQQFTSHPVVGVSPFNEADYWSKEEGATAEIHRDVSKKLKNDYARFADGQVAIVGGNTLNDDKALSWFNTGRDYYDWGNTHQLAGSFANFANFYQQMQQQGKLGYADEMHNVGEAMVGLEYGMTVGIWWGFDSRARGEFCQISRNGERLAYAEHRNNWTAASVYRHDDGKVKAFVGSSERQALTTTYQFVSPDRDVYYDGQGPMRVFSIEMPGGTGYQTGQTNAERVIDITWGEDVAPSVISGIYKLVNKATKNVAAINGNNIEMQKSNTVNKQQQWNVHASDHRIGGDYSFIDIESVLNSKTRMNVENFSTKNNANVMAYSQNATPSSNEQWYLEYAGNGYYYVKNRETALCLMSASNATSAGVNVLTYEQLEPTDTRHDRQLWRFLPVDVTYETVAPAKPENLIAVAGNASVRLSWTMGSEEDLDGYMVLRAPKGTDDWNTIARKVKTAYFTDNTCGQSTSYIYKVKAIDLAENQSQPSEIAEATPTGEKGLVAQWQFDNSVFDLTPNMMDAVSSAATPLYIDDHKSGSKALRLMATQSHYVQLPYEIANSDELTFAAWVNVRNNSSWQRIFDFGNGTDQYMFLTPNNGSIMRFAIKNGGNEQSVECNTKLATLQWKHVAVTIGKDKTSIYVDGVEVASSTGITIKPSDIRPAMNYIGRSQFNADPYLTGYIDDVRIYNYALDAAEVKAVMDDTADGITTIEQAQEQPAVVYGIDGRKQNGLKRGINIMSGKKVIVQ